MNQGIYLGLAVGCLVYLLYTAWQTYEQLHVISTPQRLVNIGIIIAFGYVGGECGTRAGW
jgi:hypothetical protein